MARVSFSLWPRLPSVVVPRRPSQSDRVAYLKNNLIDLEPNFATISVPTYSMATSDMTSPVASGQLQNVIVKELNNSAVV